MSASCVSFRRFCMSLFAVFFLCACLAPSPAMAKEKKEKAEKKEKTKTRTKTKREKAKKEDKEDKGDKVVIKDEAALLTVLNKADAKALVAVRGVGKKLAEAIIAKRPYKEIGDLLEVEGIAEKRLEKIKESIGKSKVPASVFDDDEEEEKE